MSNRQEGRRDIDSTFQPMHEDAGKEKQFAGAELTSENLSADMDSIGHGKEFGGGQGHVTSKQYFRLILWTSARRKILLIFITVTSILDGYLSF